MKLGYLHIPNLYKEQDMLLFKEAYALEKIHGTSAHIAYDGEGKITYFSGGEKHEKFTKIFNHEKLLSLFKEQFQDEIIVFGEAYGGSCQGMKHTYGDQLKFVAFDVKIKDAWLKVPDAEDVCKKLEIEFVDYNQIETNLELIDIERDKPSTQAKRNGIKEEKIREGIVLRPLIEVTKNNGERVICKHKRAEFIETATVREVKPEQAQMINDATKVAEEWVTPMRLNHVLDKLCLDLDIKNTGTVIKAMLEDIHREAKGEIPEDNSEVDKQIGRKTATLYKQKVNKK